MLRYVIGILLLAALGYGLMEAWPLIRGPALTLDSPIESGVFPGGIVRVGGEVRRAARLTINGQATLYDQQGSFSSVFAFPRGGSILTVAVTDRFGRTVTATRSIYVPTSAPASSPILDIGVND